MGKWQSAVENMGLTRDFWNGRRVFVTGHTGFKGSWICLWLSHMGATVTGYAWKPTTTPALFEVANVASTLAGSHAGDVLDFEKLSKAVREARPEILFHMAAQSLVRQSYLEPRQTFATNIMGTVNVLEVARATDTLLAVVNVTSDKCYENDDRGNAFVEADRMGGHDPYSASKGAAEIVSAAYQRCFFSDSACAHATVRAGNVIGGGDWAPDRLVPDYLRACTEGRTLSIRSPRASRPWQHVLEPVSGYLLLAEKLATYGRKFEGSWNFGPGSDSVKPVSWVAHYLSVHYGGNYENSDSADMREAMALCLNSSKAHTELGWHPRWSLETALDRTVRWHTALQDGTDMRSFSLDEIEAYGGIAA
jgi:CDP-glucose 4,6-dehydratase